MEAKNVYKKKILLMGSNFEISIVALDEAWAFEKIDLAVKEIQRIEALLTTYNDLSETNRINQAAGIKPVKVSQETFLLIQRSLRISEITQGVFDISYGSVDQSLWNFDTAMKSLPDTAMAKRMLKLINYRNIELNELNCTVFLKMKGMRIGFGGIGKGYAVERAKYILKRESVEGGIVNASGDLTTWGLQPDGTNWTIGIVHPNFSNTIFSNLNVTNMAVATSGNHEKFITVKGKKYSHTINPKTGLPVRGLKRVTIISPNAEIADAMATPVTIMGIEAGLAMINQIKQIEAIIIDDNDKIYTSSNLNFK